MGPAPGAWWASALRSDRLGGGLGSALGSAERGAAVFSSPRPTSRSATSRNRRAIGDFDGDDDLDLAVANKGDDDVQASCSETGPATSTLDDNYTVGDEPQDIATGSVQRGPRSSISPW